MKLYQHQLDALEKIKRGCILCGGVGSGKSITSLSHFYLFNGGDERYLSGGSYKKMTNPMDLYIITTARKRDTHEWDLELKNFFIFRDTKKSIYKKQNVVIDSWNNIKKYADVKGAYFVFDEQRVVGSGTWVKAFLKIARENYWVLLSATPGDTWSDYIPVFLANGFYKNKTEFTREHVVYSRFTKFPMIDRYLNTQRLTRLRNRILIPMIFKRETVTHDEDVIVPYAMTEYKKLMKERWNIWDDKPIETASELCYSLRKIVNSDESRQIMLLEIMEKHPKAIVFYNFDYELDILKEICYSPGTEIAEWNGHKHQEIPRGEKWVYLVQYNAGAEGWNCITTDTVIFWSQNYSYKILEQAKGRINRLNTPYRDLYYYHLKSKASIDVAISRALRDKKKFNETGWCRNQ